MGSERPVGSLNAGQVEHRPSPCYPFRMYRIISKCDQCGAPFATKPGDDAFCAYCGFPLPSPLIGLGRNLTALHQLLDECVHRKNWLGVAQVMEQILGEVKRKAWRAKYLHALALVKDRELRRSREAEALWREALREDPACIVAFDSLCRKLMARRAYREVERCYMAAIEATSRREGRREISRVLWRGLGALYRDNLGAPEEAALCFQRAERLGAVP